MKVQRLSDTDGFIVWDLDDATTADGIVRLAPKVLQDGAKLLARSTTYAFGLFGVENHAGASAGINSKPDDRDAAVAAFVEEVRPLTEAGQVRLSPGLGVTVEDLAPLESTDPDPSLVAAGAIAASRVSGPSDWRTAAVVGSGPVVDAATEQLKSAGSTLGEARFDAACDVLFVAGKSGCLDHATAEMVKARTVVPLTPVPVTARALAILGRAECVVIPDFLSTAAPLLATYTPDDGDPVERIGSMARELAGEGTGMWLAAATKAEHNLASWTKERPFGRPLA